MIDLDGLDWTNELPEEAGFYFTRNKAVTSLVQVIELYEGSGELRKLRIRGSGKKIEDFSHTWEFSKPLEILIAP